MLLLYVDEGNGVQRFFMEVRSQRAVKAGQELTIRYNSVYQVMESSPFHMGVSSEVPFRSSQH